MRYRVPLAVVITGSMALASAGIATAHGGGEDGHVPANTNYGISPVGYSPLEGVQDSRYTDVWAHEGHAYVGSFQEPDCSNDGVYITDIRDPENPEYLGQIHSLPGTRVNDVKVTDVGERDILVFTHEVCGSDFAITSASEVGTDRSEFITDDGIVGQGSDGISLYDVTNPRAPRALVKGFLDTEVHNTYPWTNEDGRTFLLVVDNFNADDTWIVEITNPRDPQLLVKTGLATWLEEGHFDVETSELFLGTFAFPLLHDVWVEHNPVEDRWEAVLSYWDAGFVKLDVSDPANPAFLDDSDYLEQDPILAEERSAFDGRPEGNAHAAVFGGDDNQFIFGGDEDFDAMALTITQGDVSAAANDGSDTPPVPEEGLSGPLTHVGMACDGSPAVPAASNPTAIALVERGVCTFTEKAGNVSAAGYAAGVLFNSEPNGCDGSISMLVEGDIPFMSITRAEGFAFMGLDCAAGDTVPAIGTTFDPVTITSSFVGWGYFWALNNQAGPMDVSGPEPMTEDGPSASIAVEPMGTVGYYAPAEIADPELASGAGDLTMHNLEADIRNRDRTFISWYSLGMRAVEFRDGHFHDDSNNEGSYSWNVHEVGRWIAGDIDSPDSHLELAGFAAQHGLDVEDLVGSNFWGVTQAEIDGERYILGSDRNTGLWIFEYDCQDPDGAGPLYCDESNETP